MNKKFLLIVIIGVMSHSNIAQISFTDGTSGLNDTNLKSGVAMAVVDLNNDNLDDVLRFSNASGLRIEFQQSNGTFEKINVGNVGTVWGVAIADVDENGYNDIITGGAYNGLKLILANNDGTAYTISTLGGPNIFLQNANFADINSDGAIDFFGCHDEGVSSPYKNNGSGSLTYDLDLINAESTIPSDNSGNYGSIWMDYDNDGDLDMYLSKCRLGVTDPLDGRRVNLLFQNDGSNNFTDVAEASGLRPLEQSWSTGFEDIDNDGDLDAVMINHPDLSKIYENNGDGTFTNITASSGITAELQDVGYGIQVAMEDFNNDTYVDILMTTKDGNHHLFLNDGDKTFTPVSAPFPTTAGTTMQSTAVGDLNNDGFIDVLAGYANNFNNPSSISDQLFINDGNSNNWSKIILEGVESNSNGIGARVELYGTWGMQIREVRAGESYGTQNSLASHFGLGSAVTIDQIIVRWPSGIVDEITDPPINETINIVEGQVLGINDFSTGYKMLLSPNPVKDLLTLKLNLGIEYTSLSIYDVTGSIVYQQDINGIGQEIIDVSFLNAGLYFISVEDKTIKLIKK
jgi:ASPIC/UnbV protein/VCBS repeat protein/type IX secretion system substrate protein